jgi:Phasin protein
MAQHTAQNMAQDERSSDNAGLAGPAIAARGMAMAQNLAQSVLRGNMEVMGLASRRARAQMDFSKQAMACRSPADIGQLGGLFWRDAIEDYMAFNHRLMSMWTQNMTAMGQGDFARASAGFADRVTRPITEAAEGAVTRAASRPADPWSWWIPADPAGARPSSNGHSADEARSARSSY